MRNALWLSLLIATALHAETSASHSFPQPCPELQSAALALFQHNGLPLTPDPACPLCFTGKTEHLKDAAGHPVHGARTAIKRYMDTSRDGRNIPGAWLVHRDLTTTANLRLEQTATACTGHLLFGYSWYATEILVILPVDGDPASRPSNLRLEHEYLDQITKEVRPLSNTARK